MKPLFKAIYGALLGAFLFATSIFPQIQSENLTLLANINEYPASGYNDVWGYTDEAGREYALLGIEDGLSIIDISDPANAFEVAFFSTTKTTWKDIKTYQHYAYVVIDGVEFGMQIIDLSDLPNSASLVQTYTDNGFGSSHNISIDTDNGILYAERNSVATRVISLADPENPVELLAISHPGHHDIVVQDNILYVSEGSGNSFSLYDVSDPQNPSLLQRFNPPSSGYAHNSWPTEDGKYLFTAEEVPAELTVKVWDIQDLNNISLIDEYIASPTGRPHNVHIKGDYAYISHYWDGLRILDIRNPANVEEIGFYDTFPDAGSGFAGNWGVYPNLRSGKILVSDRTYGLFVLYFEGADERTSNTPDDPIGPESFELRQNFPNPFNPSTKIRFSLPVSSQLTMSVHDITGRPIRTLFSGTMSTGIHTIEWDGRNDAGQAASSGIYIYRMRAVATGLEANYTIKKSGRMILLR